jgi:hypothetical protein
MKVIGSEDELLESSIKRTKFFCFTAVFILLIARNPVWTMLWDADGYVNSAIIWATGGTQSSVAEQLYYRGFLTSIVYYLPSYIGIKYFEPTQFGTYIFVFVLVQNALIISWMSSFVLPKIVGLFRPATSLTVITTSFFGFYVLGSFVPYTLMDLWAMACLLPVIYLIYSQSKIALIMSGGLLGICLNLRPSYLFAIILLIGSATFIKRLSVMLIVPGFLISQIPQIIYNSKWHDSFSIFPLGLGRITGRLATFASYSIRYDTNAYGAFTPKGGISFCDQKMMEIALRVKPESTFETALLFLQNPGHSSLFLIKKLAAAFWWPVTVPYFEHNPLVNSIFGALILFIVTFGLSKIIWLFYQSDQKVQYLGVVAVIVGFCINLVLYSNETRYGASVVLISICGIAILINEYDLLKVKFNFRILLSKENMIALTVYLFFAGVASFTLMGDFGFQTIKNCG